VPLFKITARFKKKICLPYLFILYKNICVHESQLEIVLGIATLFKNSGYANF